MSTSKLEAGSAAAPELAERSALIVGVGGLGCPAALALVDAGVGRLLLADDDRVDVTNLHRQVLFEDEDVGRDKLDAAIERLGRRARPGQRIEPIRSRLLPDNARDLVRDVDVVLEGADNYATKFLCSDACALERRAVVHGAAIRFRATVWSVGPLGRPCYRCLFESPPAAEAGQSCAEAGVMGPAVGFAGALMAELALSALEGRPRTGLLYAYDGFGDRLREVPVSPRPSCPLCGEAPTISVIDELCYTPIDCADGASIGKDPTS